MATAAQLHVDSALSNIAVQYQNDEFIADKIYPILQVNKRSNKFFTFPKAEALRKVDTTVGPNSRAGSFTYNPSTDNYSVQDHALEDFVSYDEVANADAPLDPFVDATEFLTHKLRLDLEDEVAGIAFSSSTYASANKATPATKWANASSTPIAQILTAINALVGVPRPYTIAFGLKAWELFSQHPDVVAAIQPTGQQVVAKPEQVAAFFGFDECLIGGAAKQTALEGGTASYSRIWGDHVLIFKRESGPSMLRKVALGRIFLFNNFEVVRWQDMSLGPKGGEYVKPSWSYDVKTIAADAGYLIYDVEA